MIKVVRYLQLPWVPSKGDLILLDDEREYLSGEYIVEAVDITTCEVLLVKYID